MKKIGHLVLFSALVSGTAFAHGHHDKELSVKDCLIQAPIADGKISAAFFTLDNHGKESVKLTAVESPELSKNVQIHEMTMKDGMMEMKQIADYEVTTGEHTFKKGGYHIMLEDLEKAPEVGKSYPLTLHFSNNQALTCQAKVLTAPEVIEHFKKLGTEVDDHGHHHDHGKTDHDHKHADHDHGKADHDHKHSGHDHGKTDKK